MSGPGAFWYSGTAESQLLAGAGSVTGTASLTVAQPVIAASGTYTPPPITGSAALSVTQPTIAASGKLEYSGSGALSVTAPSIGATGQLKYIGTAALTVTAPRVAGIGTSGDGIAGTASLTVTAPTIAASGTITGSSAAGWGDPRIAKLLQKGMRPKKRPRREEVPVPVYELPDDDPDWETIVLALLN